MYFSLYSRYFLSRLSRLFTYELFIQFINSSVVEIHEYPKRCYIYSWQVTCFPITVQFNLFASHATIGCWKQQHNTVRAALSNTREHFAPLLASDPFLAEIGAPVLPNYENITKHNDRTVYMKKKGLMPFI
jgi:hypothetical protein